MSSKADPRRRVDSQSRTWWWVAAGLAVLSSFGIWSATTHNTEIAKVRREAAPDSRARVVAAARVTSEEAVHEEPIVPATTIPTAAPAPVVPTARGEVVVGAAPDAPHEPGMVPHPLDAAHARLHAENRLMQGLNDAMSFRQVATMRALLAEYRTLDPADADATQAGYGVIADCIEFPGDASLTAAHEFYDTERHSPLRRYVRRMCFENTN